MTGTTRLTRHIRAPRARVYRALLNAEAVRAIEFESDDPAMQGEMTVTYRLTDADNGTELLGWSISIGKLADLVESPE